MTKMISYRVWHKKFDEYPGFKILSEKSDRPVLESSNSFVDIECDGFHVIPLSFSDHPVIANLIEYAQFDMNDDSNVLYLPIIPAQSYMLETSYFTDSPIESYLDIVKNFLEPLASAEIISKCKAGDQAVTERVLGNVRRLQSALTSGLKSRECHAAYPYTEVHFRRDQAAWSNLTKQ